MNRDKGQCGRKRLVWRMDALHPAGAVIDPDEPPTLTERQPGVVPEGWQDSSLAPLDGLVVSEVPPDSGLDELFDEFRVDRH